MCKKLYLDLAAKCEIHGISARKLYGRAEAHRGMILRQGLAWPFWAHGQDPQIGK